MTSVKRYDGNCFWKDGLENVPSLSLFENIKNEMIDWDVKVEYISFDEIQVTSKDTPAQFILINNERGYVLNGEVTLANEVKVYKYNLDYISTFFLPFLSNLQTQPLYIHTLRSPFFDSKTAIQCDDEKIEDIPKIGRYLYGKNYYYKENTTYNGANVVRYYDDYSKTNAQNYIEYQSNNNIVNSCIYFVFADGENNTYRFLPVLAKSGQIIYANGNEVTSTEPEHTYTVSINNSNPLRLMPNYQEFINANNSHSNRNCTSYGLTKTFNFTDIVLTNGTNSNNKFPSSISGNTLTSLLNEYAGYAYLSFPDYGGEDTSNNDYIKICDSGNTNSNDKHYIDANTINSSNIKVYWSMVKNTASDSHYYNYFDNNMPQSVYNRLLLRDNGTYQTYSNGTGGIYGACDFSFVNANKSYKVNVNNGSYDFSFNWSVYSTNSVTTMPLSIGQESNIFSIGSNIVNSSNLCYKYILVTPYKFEVNLKKYNQSNLTTLYNNFYSYKGTNFQNYLPYFPKTPTLYMANNVNDYNATAANYSSFGNCYMLEYLSTNANNINSNIDGYNIAVNKAQGYYLFKRYLHTLSQSTMTTSLKITFPQKNNTTLTRKNIDNSWESLYNYATSYYPNQSSSVSQFIGIYMLPHLFSFNNDVKSIQTRGSFNFLELNLPPEGVDIKPFKFLNGTNFNFSNPTPSKILHPNDVNIKASWWYFSKYSDCSYMNNKIQPEFYFQAYNQMESDGWFCFNGNGTYIDKLDLLSLKASIWTLPNQLPSYTNTYAQYVQNTINSANTSYQVAKNNMLSSIAGGLLNIAGSAAMGAFSMGMGNVLAGALGDIGGIVGGIGRTSENAAMGATPMTNFVTNNKIKLSKLMGASQLTSGALKNSGGLFASIIGFKNRQMEIKAHYKDAKNKLQNKLNPSTSDDISLLEQWLGETSQYNVVEYFFPDEVTYKQWNSVLYYYSFKCLKNEYSNVLFNENNWSMFNDCVYFVLDDNLMKSKIQSYKPYNDLYTEVKKYIYELLTNGFRIWIRKPEECEI